MPAIFGLAAVASVELCRLDEWRGVAGSLKVLAERRDRAQLRAAYLQGADMLADEKDGRREGDCQGRGRVGMVVWTRPSAMVTALQRIQISMVACPGCTASTAPPPPGAHA